MPNANELHRTPRKSNPLSLSGVRHSPSRNHRCQTNQDTNPLYRIDATKENERLYELQVAEATKRSMEGIRAPSATYDELHYRFGWPPLKHDSVEATALDDDDASEDDSGDDEPPFVESFLSATDNAPVSSTPADKRLHPGYDKVDESSTIRRSSCSNKEHNQGHPDKHKHVRFKTEEKRTNSPCPFDGQVIDIALIACGLSTTLFLPQNG